MIFDNQSKKGKSYLVRPGLMLLFVAITGIAYWTLSNMTESVQSQNDLLTANNYEKDSNYELKHKNTAWYKSMSEPNADYFKVRAEYIKYFGEHNWEKSKPRQLAESWIKTKLAYLDKDGRVQDMPAFDASRHTVTNSVMMGTTTSVGSWDMLGPVNSFGAPYASIYNHGGYVYMTRFDPNNTSKVFASFVTGGLWMTSDNGVIWTLTDTNMPDEAYIDLDVSQSNSSIVYAVTQTRVIKSVDGGLSYANTGLTSATHTGTGYGIAVSPTDANVVIARWGDKIYRTTDGGTNWTIITSGLANHVVFDSNLTGEMVDWSTTDNNVVYALATSHNDQVTVYRSGDAGLTFTAIQTITLVAPANGSVVGWTKLMLPSNNTTHIYVAIGSGNNQYSHFAAHLYKLDNTTGAIASSRINMVDGNAPTQIHHGDITMDRNDENKIMYGTYSQGKVHYSSDNGVTFTTPASNNTHADIRSLNIVSGKAAIGSDGELVTSTDGGVTNTCISNSISNHELWGFGAAFKSDLIAVGCNHGPVMIKETHNGFDWYNGFGADQQNTDVNPLDDKYIHTRGYAQRRLIRTGPHELISESNLLDIGGLEYFNNVHFHPNLYNTLITHHAGGFPTGNPNLATWKNSLIRTDDQGNSISIINTFTDQVYREKICMTNPDVIYVVVGLSSNKLWKTVDGGTTWTDVTPTLAESSNKTHISDIAVSDVDPNEVWITYSSVQTTCKILKSTDGGATWPTNLTTPTLSSYPTERIVHQRGSNGGVYTGNKDGVYYRNNTMADWALLGNGLPLMDIRWLFINYNLGKLRIGTSRGAWEHDLFETSPPKAQISADMKTVDCPNIQSVQFRDYSTVRNASATWAWSFPGGTPSTSTLENPLVSYAGAADGAYNVSLTVTDAFGSDSQTLSEFIIVNGTGSGCSIDTIPGKLLTVLANTDDAQTKGALGIKTNTMTMSCWIKPSGAQSGNPGLITTESGTATGLVIRGGGVGYVWGNHSYSWSYNSGLTVPNDTWSHVAMVIAPGSATMYLNGIPAVNNSHGVDSINFLSNFHFGSDRGKTNDHFIGSLDEICIYDRALSTDEIRELMNLTRNNPNTGSLPNVDASLKAYYQINEGAGKPIYDKVGGNHANLVGGASNTVLSTAPVGGGTFQRMNITTGGLKDFAAPGVELTFPGSGTYPNGDVVVTRLNVPSDVLAGESVLPDLPVSYYVVRSYGTNSTFSSLTGMKFKKVKEMTDAMVGEPAEFKLYKRASNDFGATWGSSIDDADVLTNVGGTGTIEFTTGLNVTSFSQFSIENRFIKKLAISGLRLQGAMPTTGTTMTTNINAFIPLTDPYGSGITATAIPSNVVDWVKIELKSGATPNTATTVASTAGFLLTDGTVKSAKGTDLSFNNIASGNYYIAISHRNHLGIISNAAIALSGGTTVTVDFATLALYTDGTISNTPTATINGVKALWAGDVDNNGRVRYLPLAIPIVPSDALTILTTGLGGVPNASLTNTYSVYDVNMDGKVRYLPQAIPIVPSDALYLLSNTLGGVPNAEVRAHQ